MNESLVKQVQELAKDTNRLSFLCNICALLNEKINNINWVGFYLAKNNTLFVGPFQGKVACQRIENGKGVCGKCYENGEVLNVKNVKDFPGYIACDQDTKSELCIPLIYNDKKIGVLDVDSKVINRFNEYDTNTLIEISEIISRVLAD